MKNKLINGACVIDQRNAGASYTPPSGSSSYSLDRWSWFVTQSSKLTTQQSSTAPVGFVNSLLTTSSSAYTVGSGDIFELRQFVEGFNTSDLNWGTANAKTVTLSFQVYSSITGTFGGAIRNSDSSRSYDFSYTVSSANTWTSVSITIAGDTTGTWLTTNGRGMVVGFSMGAGSTYLKSAGSWSAGEYEGVTGQTNLVGTNGATFYITGMQLERGSSATGFEYRQYQQEFALCQRYYEVVGQTVYCATMSDAFGRAFYFFRVAKRATPTVVNTGGAGSITASTDIIYSAQSAGAASVVSGATASSEL